MAISALARAAELLDRGEHLARIGGPIARLLREAARDQVRDRGADLGQHRVEPRRRVLDVLEQDHHRVVGARRERRLAGDQRVQAAAERVDVGRGGDLRALALLGRHELGRAEHRAFARRARRRGAARLRVRLDEPGDAEVAELDDLAGRVGVELDARAHEHHVVGLEVAVDDAEPVRLGQRAATVGDDAEREPLGQLAEPLERAVHAAARDQLEHEVVDAAVLVEVDVVRDVRAADLREHARLLAEAIQQALVGGDLGLEQLDRDIGAAGLVGRLPHLAHRAGAELLGQLVAADREPERRPRHARRAEHLDADRRVRAAGVTTVSASFVAAASRRANSSADGRASGSGDVASCTTAAHGVARDAAGARHEQLEQRTERKDIGGRVRLGLGELRCAARDHRRVLDRARVHRGELEAQPIARADVHRPRLQAAVADPDVMGRRDRARELGHDLERARTTSTDGCSISSASGSALSPSSSSVGGCAVLSSSTPRTAA